MKRSGFKNPGKPLAPGKGFKPRAAPMARGTSTLATRKPLVAKKPIERGDVQLRARKPAKDKPKRAARDREGQHYLEACRGQPCYLLVPGVAYHDPATVVPCHSNSAARGKGMGIKAQHEFTVPGCHACHAILDQGRDLDKAERHALWDAAYARWEPVRAEIQQAVSS